MSHFVEKGILLAAAGAEKEDFVGTYTQEEGTSSYNPPPPNFAIKTLIYIKSKQGGMTFSLLAASAGCLGCLRVGYCLRIRTRCADLV